MNCPLCLDTVLDISFHGGIELDICPRCRGVWLDRGELERLADGTSGRSARDGQSDTRRVQGSLAASHTTADATPAARSSRKNRKNRLSDRLGEVFEEILDI
jgi:Zn-finger nucleic acid-binding protein